MASLPHGMYAIGGYDGHQALKSIELYDYSKEKWIEVGELRHARFAHTAVLTSDLQYLIICGGYDTKALRSLEVFDIHKEKVIAEYEMKEDRFLHCSVIANF